MQQYHYIFTWKEHGLIVTKHIYAESAKKAKDELKLAFGKDADNSRIGMTRKND